jgi:hypothetical protein
MMQKKKEESKNRFSGTTNVREILYFAYSMARCTSCLIVVAMFLCGPLPAAHTAIFKIKFPFLVEDLWGPYVMVYRPFRSQWLLEVPPSLTIKNSSFFQQNAFANSV